MSSDDAPKSNRASLPSLILRSVVAGLCGAALGAIAFGWGIYFASYSDRLMPFYPVGAIAGGAGAVLFALLFGWRTDHSKRTPARPFIAAIFGAVVLWVAMSDPKLGMELSSRAVAAAIWLFGSSLIFFLIGRRTH